MTWQLAIAMLLVGWAAFVVGRRCLSAFRGQGEKGCHGCPSKSQEPSAQQPKQRPLVSLEPFNAPPQEDGDVPDGERAGKQ